MQGNNDNGSNPGPAPKRSLNKLIAHTAARLRGLLPKRGRSVQRAFLEGVAYKLGSGIGGALIYWYIQR